MKKNNWLLDQEHSSIVFKVKHMVISTVTGQFNRFRVEASSEGENFEKGSVECVINAKDVTTNDDYRDNHLKSAALLDVDKYQEIRFSSANFERRGEQFVIKGELTIKDITKSIDIPVTYLGKNDVNNIKRSAFESDFVVHRDDFNLTYNTLLESGGMVIGNEIAISVYITLINKGE